MSQTPPFKHFTLMEQTPTIANDSATPLQKVFAEVSDMTLPELADYVLELQSQLASKDKQIERLRDALGRSLDLHTKLESMSLPEILQTQPLLK